MPFNPALAHADLRTIRDRRPSNPDVIALLWTVKRLRARLLRVYQLSLDFKRPAGERKLRDVLATGERDGLLVIDHGASPATYRATFILERLLPAAAVGWPD